MLLRRHGEHIIKSANWFEGLASLPYSRYERLSKELRLEIDKALDFDVTTFRKVLNIFLCYLKRYEKEILNYIDYVELLVSEVEMYHGYKVAKEVARMLLTIDGQKPVFQNVIEMLTYLTFTSHNLVYIPSIPGYLIAGQDRLSHRIKQSEVDGVLILNTNEIVFVEITSHAKDASENMVKCLELRRTNPKVRCYVILPGGLKTVLRLMCKVSVLDLADLRDLYTELEGVEYV